MIQNLMLAWLTIKSAVRQSSTSRTINIDSDIFAKIRSPENGSIGTAQLNHTTCLDAMDLPEEVSLAIIDTSKDR
ncbi:MAG: hypothetical protein P2975_06725 [Gemmatimonadota bacterium]|nr:hypothetical protein [Gemmatimonadota bacterium]MDQ8178555.1 hypothetical protein [Gemmatimonadota bacterium]